jgi:hypothetical protein
MQRQCTELVSVFCHYLQIVRRISSTALSVSDEAPTAGSEVLTNVEATAAATEAKKLTAEALLQVVVPAWKFRRLSIF